MTFLKHCKTGLLAFWLAPKNHGKSGLHHEHVAPHEKTERRGMSNSPPLNPFMSVRPRSKDMPSAPAPRKTNHSRAPIEGNVHLLLDSNGRQTVSLERRTKGGITIENREQSLANEAKLARRVGGVR